MIMPTPKKDNLPVNADVDLQNGGTITYANEVIAIIAGVAANEVEGLAGMCTSGGIGDIIGRNRNITRGVRVEIGTEEASVDIYAIIEYGQPIQKVASEVQENVRKAIETMTGLHVVRVDVHVQGVSFEKEKKAAKAGLEAAHTAVLEAPIKTASEKTEEASAEAPKAEETPAEEPKAEEAPAPEAPVEDEPKDEEPVADADEAIEEAAEEAEAENEAVEEPAEEAPACDASEPENATVAEEIAEEQAEAAAEEQ